MPTPNPTRPYSIPGFRIALVREPGVKLAERPELRSPAEAVPMLAQYIGETDRRACAGASGLDRMTKPTLVLRLSS